MSFKFEKLEIWKEALEISAQVNSLTQTFPKSELFNLTSQIQRAADSAVLNIAEGSQGQSNREFARFLNMAIRSSIEVVSCLYIAQRRGYINKATESPLYTASEKLIKRTQTLRNTLIPKTNFNSVLTILWSMVHGLWSIKL